MPPIRCFGTWRWSTPKPKTSGASRRVPNHPWQYQKLSLILETTVTLFRPVIVRRCYGCHVAKLNVFKSIIFTTFSCIKREDTLVLIFFYIFCFKNERTWRADFYSFNNSSYHDSYSKKYIHWMCRSIFRINQTQALWNLFFSSIIIYPDDFFSSKL